MSLCAQGSVHMLYMTKKLRIQLMGISFMLNAQISFIKVFYMNIKVTIANYQNQSLWLHPPPNFGVYTAEQSTQAFKLLLNIY